VPVRPPGPVPVSPAPPAVAVAADAVVEAAAAALQTLQNIFYGLALLFIPLTIIPQLMNLSKLHPQRFWSTDNGLTALLVFTLMYLIVLMTLSEFSFGSVVARLGSDPEALQRQLAYFSYITLTSTGYGDITPVHPVARLLAMFEALAGQLYLAITLARLVSLEIMHRQEKL
jgi:hypothetical protein